MQEWKALLITAALLAMGLSLGAQEACCPGGGSAAIGFAIHQNTPFLLGRFWLNSRTAFEMGLANPFQFDWFYVANLQALRDLCSFRPYIAVGTNLPIRYGNWWITGWAGVGVEWCPPGLEGLAVGVTGGIAFTYCLCCRDCWYCPWYYCWVQGTWFTLSLSYYLPPL